MYGAEKNQGVKESTAACPTGVRNDLKIVCTTKSNCSSNVVSVMAKTGLTTGWTYVMLKTSHGVLRG